MAELDAPYQSLTESDDSLAPTDEHFPLLRSAHSKKKVALDLKDFEFEELIKPIPQGEMLYSRMLGNARVAGSIVTHLRLTLEADHIVSQTWTDTSTACQELSIT
jgi:hypothetical protein